MNLDTPLHPGEQLLLNEFSQRQLQRLAAYMDVEKTMREDEGYGHQTLETLTYMIERLRFLAHNRTIPSHSGLEADV